MHGWTKTNGYWDPTYWSETDQWRVRVSPSASLELYFDRQTAINNGGMARATMDNEAYIMKSLSNAS